MRPPRHDRLPFLHLLGLAIGLAFGLGCGSGGPTAAAEGPALSGLDLDPGILGSDWKATDSLRLDDWSGIPALHSVQRPIAETLRETLGPRGLVAVASFGFGRTEPPLDSADLRIFRFRTSAEREAWTREKYGYDGWEAHYTREDAPHLVLDSTQVNKRIVGIGPWWITAGALRPGDTPQVLLDHALAQLGLP